MQAKLDPRLAQTRHPEEAAQLMQGLGIDDPTLAKWNYAMAVRIDGAHRAQVDKGVNVFLRNPDPYYISLEASVGRKRREVALDKAKLLDGPRECLPVELFQSFPRPQGVSAFFWQPHRTQCPGWNELVLTGGLRQGDTVLLRGMTDEGGQEFLRLQAGQWSEVEGSVACATFGKALAAKVGNWLGKDKSLPPQAGVETLSFEQIEQLIASLPDRKLPARPSSVADILGELGFGAEEAEHLAQGKQVAAPPAQGGRVFAWGEQIDDDAIADYVRLLQAQAGPSSGNALEVMMGLANPANGAFRELSADVLDRLAHGAAREAALSTSLANFAAANGFPSPAPGVDPIEYVRRHLQSAPPVPMRPVMLPRR